MGCPYCGCKELLRTGALETRRQLAAGNSFKQVFCRHRSAWQPFKQVLPPLLLAALCVGTAAGRLGGSQQLIGRISLLLADGLAATLSDQKLAYQVSNGGQGRGGGHAVEGGGDVAPVATLVFSSNAVKICQPQSCTKAPPSHHSRADGARAVCGSVEQEWNAPKTFGAPPRPKEGGCKSPC